MRNTGCTISANSTSQRVSVSIIASPAGSALQARACWKHGAVSPGQGRSVRPPRLPRPAPEPERGPQPADALQTAKYGLPDEAGKDLHSRELRALPSPDRAPGAEQAVFPEAIERRTLPLVPTFLCRSREARERRRRDARPTPP